MCRLQPKIPWLKIPVHTINHTTMKYLIHSSLLLLAFLSFTACDAQIQHAKTIQTTVYGDCGMCEKTIKKAAFVKGEAQATWDMDTKIAIFTFDSTRTNVDAILARIAAAGYDSDKYTAADTTYNNLPTCCQYERPVKVAAAVIPDAKPTGGMTKKQAVVVNPLSAVYAAYFELKDALVATDGKMAATKAKVLSDALTQVSTGAMTAPQNTAWTNLKTGLGADAAKIQGITDTQKQRATFSDLTSKVYDLMKEVKPGTTVYFDYCPMYNNGKGGNWLSLEEEINNPYFGKQMLHCGSTTAVLK